MTKLTLDELIELFNECAGDAEPDEAHPDPIDVPFDQLGYDSLTVLNAVVALERTHGVSLPDTVVGEARTPRQLLDAVHAAAV